MASEEASTLSSFKITLTGDGLSIDRQIDPETARAVVDLVLGGSGGTSSRSTSSNRTKQAKKSASSGEGKPRRRKASPGIVKDLSLRPKGKKSFVEFVEEKDPHGHFERQTVAVYWLQKIAEVGDAITADHVNTCYQAAKWKRPADLTNNLRLTATRKGWIDTSDTSDLKITVSGEDFVDHELPAKKE